jgi:hypothetical protein
MKIIFEEDNSFLEVLPSGKTITIILCGRKSHNEVTMSSAELSNTQVDDLLNFLISWKKEKE